MLNEVVEPPSGAVRRWVFVAALGGLGRRLVADLGRQAWVLAPPGTPLRRGEQADDLQFWRSAVWLAEPEVGINLSFTEPLAGSATCLPTRAVLTCVPGEFHDWVRSVMRRQLHQTLAFTEPEPGRPVNDARARAAAVWIDALRADLRDAFPDESWYECGDVEVSEVPDTPAELFAAFGAPRAERLFSRGTAMVLVPNATPLAAAGRGRPVAARIGRTLFYRLPQRMKRAARYVVRSVVRRLPRRSQRWVQKTHATHRRIRAEVREEIEARPVVGV